MLPSGQLRLITVYFAHTEIEERFKKSGVPYKVHFSSPAHSIEDICEELTSSGENVNLVILGGDGTMNAVVNGIRDFEHTKVGFIQIGSGNDLMKGLGIDQKIDDLTDSILRGEVVRTCDIGRVTFHNRIDLLDPFTHRPIAPSAAGSAGSPASGTKAPQELPKRLQLKRPESILPQGSLTSAPASDLTRLSARERTLPPSRTSSTRSAWGS